LGAIESAILPGMAGSGLRRGPECPADGALVARMSFAETVFLALRPVKNAMGRGRHPFGVRCPVPACGSACTPEAP